MKYLKLTHVQFYELNMLLSKAFVYDIDYTNALNIQIKYKDSEYNINLLKSIGYED